MSGFMLQIHDSTHSDRFEGVASFVGEDASGSFGIMAGHERMMTCLVIGLARFRTGEADWRYLALPGGVLYFRDNTLIISTRHYLIDDDYMRISALLEQELLAEEENLHAIRTSLHRMEEEVLRHLWRMGRQAG